MKRLSALVLCLCLLFTLAACGSKKDTATDGNAFAYIDENGDRVTTYIATTGQVSTTDPASIVEIYLPSSCPELNEEKYAGNLQLYCSDMGFDSFETDSESGRITFRMTASAYDSLTFNKGLELIGILSGLMKGTAYPYFTDIESYDDDFSTIVLTVDKELYEKDSMSPIFSTYVGDLCMHSYQLFTSRNEYGCIVTVKSEDGEVLSEKTYCSDYSFVK